MPVLKLPPPDNPTFIRWPQIEYVVPVAAVVNGNQLFWETCVSVPEISCFRAPKDDDFEVGFLEATYLKPVISSSEIERKLKSRTIAYIFIRSLVLIVATKVWQKYKPLKRLLCVDFDMPINMNKRTFIRKTRDVTFYCEALKRVVPNLYLDVRNCVRDIFKLSNGEIDVVDRAALLLQGLPALSYAEFPLHYRYYCSKKVIQILIPRRSEKTRVAITEEDQIKDLHLLHSLGLIEIKEEDKNGQRTTMVRRKIYRCRDDRRLFGEDNLTIFSANYGKQPLCLDFAEK